MNIILNLISFESLNQGLVELKKSKCISEIQFIEFNVKYYYSGLICYYN